MTRMDDDSEAQRTRVSRMASPRLGQDPSLPPPPRPSPPRADHAVHRHLVVTRVVTRVVKRVVTRLVTWMIPRLVMLRSRPAGSGAHDDLGLVKVGTRREGACG